MFFSFLFGWNPYFIVFAANNAKFKETQKRKQNTICEHTCANCSCQNVLFCAFFFFVVLQFPIFQRCFLIGSQNSKIYKIWKQHKEKQQQQETRYKANINQTWWFKTKQDNKQKNKNKITSWTKKQTKQKEKARTRNRNEKPEGRKNENNKRERQRKKKGKRGEAQKGLKRNKGKHR